MNTLVYIRRCNVFNDSVLSFAKEHLSTSKITTVSEYFNGDFRIDMNTKQWDYCFEIQNLIEEKLDFKSIVFRDRVLRNLPLEKALVLVRRATGNIIDVLKNTRPDNLVIYPVDNYITDILVQVAKLHDISCHGVSNFFIAKYKRLTVYGEHTPTREPEDSEVESVLQQLQNNFRSHMAPNRIKAIKKAIIRYIKYSARYPLFYLLLYKFLKRNEYDLLCTPYNSTVHSFTNFFVERFFIAKDKVDYSKKSILIPLHYFPEATIEYWSGNLNQIEFEDMLLCKINELSTRYEQIILKEHPAALFDNPSSFYKRLIKNPKVVLIDPFVATTELLEKIDVIGCWTGTAGIEALVNGKKVELFVEEQYYQQALNLHPEIIKKDGDLISISEPSVFIKEILKGCILIKKNCDESYTK